MKQTKVLGAGFLAAAAMAIAVTTAGAAPPPLNGRIDVRPLTASEKKDYSLTGLQSSSGLATVGVGQPVYLEVDINSAIPSSNIVDVVWTLNKPIGSLAVLTNSPLGANVPVYEPSARLVLQVAGRTLLRPDVSGQYSVMATVTTTTSGSTNLTRNITASAYTGLQTCQLCHSGSAFASDIYHTFTNTAHASSLRLDIDGLGSSHFGKSCLSCHSLGYDTNSLAVNGGFDDVAAQLGWTFPSVLTNGNWAAMPAALQNVGSVQCESCHGPGYEHAISFGNTNVANWPRISTTLASGTCAQCHDSKDKHTQATEWNISRHATPTRTPSGPSRAACVRCHTAGGFVGAMSHSTTTNTVYEAVTCQTCHDPHDAANPHQLRAPEKFTLGDGTVVTNAGSGGFCFQCHSSRNGSVTNSIVKYPLGQQTWTGGSSFGVHDTSQADMLEGVNAVTYGLDIPSAAHRSSVSNTCAGCHMQPVASTEPGFLKSGGHTFKMSYPVVTNGVTNTVDNVSVCIKCHGQISSFDMKVADYNGDGVIEGVQTEVTRLLDQLSTLLPNSSGVVDGLVKSPSVKTNWQTKYLQGAYNYQFVKNDGSFGVHNAPYAVGLLKASIANLTGDANRDGLPDSWQIQHFGSTTSPNALPNACPAGDGVPNWLKYSLGLNPMVPGVSVTGGVVWANGNSLVPGDSEDVRIFTAAEVSFNTQVGKSYQIQAISSLGGGWSNVGGPIAGSGNAISYVTPTRSNVQQFYRVIVTP